MPHTVPWGQGRTCGSPQKPPRCCAVQRLTNASAQKVSTVNLCVWMRCRPGHRWLPCPSIWPFATVVPPVLLRYLCITALPTLTLTLTPPFPQVRGLIYVVNGKTDPRHRRKVRNRPVALLQPRAPRPRVAAGLSPRRGPCAQAQCHPRPQDAHVPAQSGRASRLRAECVGGRCACRVRRAG